MVDRRITQCPWTETHSNGRLRRPCIWAKFLYVQTLIISKLSSASEFGVFQVIYIYKYDLFSEDAPDIGHNIGQMCVKLYCNYIATILQLVSMWPCPVGSESFSEEVVALSIMGAFGESPQRRTLQPSRDSNISVLSTDSTLSTVCINEVIQS